MAIAAAPTYVLALKRDGTVTSWGANSNFVSAGWTSVVAVAAGPSHRLGLRQDATVIQSGAGAPPPQEGLTAVAAIACGSQHSLALKQDGTVIAWGQTSVPAGLSNVVAIAAAVNNSLALKIDGTVVGWGSDSLLRQVPQALDSVMAISISETHALALRTDGTVIRWGRNLTSGQDQTAPPYIKDVIAIAAGPTESLAVRAPLRFAKFEVVDHPTMHFRTFTGRDYTVEFSTDLGSASWTPLPGGRVTGTGQLATVLDDTQTTGGYRFYRFWEER